MKTRLVHQLLTLLLATPLAPDVRAQPTAQTTTTFTYQGKLTDNGSPATGFYDMKFRLYDKNGINGDYGVQKGAEFDTNGVLLANGLFTVKLDFGSTPFTGQQLWLEIDAAKQNTGAYVTLTPRTEVTPAPHAIYSQIAGKL